MPTPTITNVTPTKVHLKNEVELTVHGNNFSGDAQGHCSVDLSSDDGYTWDPSPAQGTVVSSQVIKVKSTPDDDREKGVGLGDLTTTVTNGDGSGTSAPVSQQEDYQP